MVIDVHVHVFEKINGHRWKMPVTSLKWGKVKNGEKEFQLLEPSFENSNSPVEMYLAYMEWCGIDKALLIQNPFYGYTNEYVARVVRDMPNKFAALAVVDITKGEAAADELESLIKSGFFIGLKVEVPCALQFMPELKLTDPLLRKVWQKCDDLCIPLMLHIRDGEEDFESLSILHQDYQNITFIICHLGNPPFEGWRKFLGIAALPRVYVDISGLPYLFKETEDYPFPSAQEHLRIAKEEIGVEKLLWGSDYPTILTACTYPQTINLIQNSRNFSESDVKKILGENTRKVIMI